jgi:hypothetical protein
MSKVKQADIDQLIVLVGGRETSQPSAIALPACALC